MRLIPLSGHELDDARHDGLTAAERDNVDLVLRAYDAITSGVEEDLSPFYSAGYRDHASSVSPGDLEGFRAFLKGFRESFPDTEIALDRVLADREYVFLQGRGRQRPDDEWSHTMEVFRVEAGRVAEHWEVLELAGQEPGERPLDGSSIGVLTADGVRLDVHVRGGGPGARVLFLHGVVSSRRTYDWLPADVVEGHEVVTYDFRGHGRSGHLEGTYDLQHYYDDTVRVIEEIGAPVVLVGFSLGGVVGWLLAQRRPDLVRAALLEDPPLFFEEIHVPGGPIPELLRRTLEQERGWAARRPSVDDAVAEFGRTPLGQGLVWSDLYHPDNVRVLTEGTLARDCGVVEAAIDSTMVAATDREAPPRVPVTIIGGDAESGAVFGTAHAEQLRQLHPGVECHNVEGAPHAVHASFAGREAYVDVLRSFLDRYARGR
ncbi:alpha/beta fold hydrolase [Lentzea sp. NPDC059081]|uniref:alpha/beta fold hydrolase n=1 Tax=Lentzea sp. NPDC059081 TaxID=3346719 RepID=UPI0036D090F3